MVRCFASILGSFLLLSTASALAQTSPADRASQEQACLRPLLARLETAVRLLGESREQLQSSDSAARADAAAAVQSLEQRIYALTDSIRACLPGDASLEAREEVQELSGAAQRVGEQNAATEVVDENHSLGGHVRIAVGERVDGRGTARADSVRTAFRSLRARIGRCYERFLEHGSLQPMTAIVVFTVRARGTVGRVLVEGGSRGSFNQCLTGAVRRMRIPGGAVGGEARYAYTLRFGSESP
ncbi:MAG: hypothetical protein AAF938_18770 [Myxococcota bacterium]